MPGQYSVNDLAPTQPGTGQFSAADIATPYTDADAWRTMGSEALQVAKGIPYAAYQSVPGVQRVPMAGGHAAIVPRDQDFEDWANQAEKNGHPVEAAGIRLLGALPFAHEVKTLFTGTREDVDKAIVDLGGNILSMRQAAGAPEVKPGAILDAAKTAAAKTGSAAAGALDVVTSPVASDIAGLVSPRAAHALNLAKKAQRVVTAISGKPGEPPPELVPTTGMTVGPQGRIGAPSVAPTGEIPTGTINVPAVRAPVPTGLSTVEGLTGSPGVTPSSPPPTGTINVPSETPPITPPGLTSVEGLTGSPAGPLPGTPPPGRTPLGLLPQFGREAAVPEAGAPAITEDVLNSISKDLTGKKFSKLDPGRQAKVQEIASKLGTALPKEAAAPAPADVAPVDIGQPSTPGTTIEQALQADMAAKNAARTAAPTPAEAATMSPADWIKAQLKPPPKPATDIPSSYADRPPSYDEGSGAPFLEGSESVSTTKAAQLAMVLKEAGLTTNAEVEALTPEQRLFYGSKADIGKPSKMVMQKVGPRLEVLINNPEEVALPRSVTGVGAEEAPSELETQLRQSLEQVKPGSGFERASQTLQDAADAALERMRQRGTFSGTKLQAGIPIDDMGDMAIWGAAKMAKGAVNFAQWSKEMIAEAGDQIKPYLQKLWFDAQKIYDKHLETTANALPNTKRLLSMYQKGIEGQDWYAKTRSELQRFFGDDTDKFMDMLAATSPNSTVASNLTLALKAFQQYRNRQEFSGFMQPVIDNLNRAVAGEELSGPKVSSFSKNLRGDPEAVTVDRWISRVMGYGEKTLTGNEYKFIDYVLTQVAKQRGIEPRQLQAAIWKAARDQAKAKTTGAPFEDVLKAKAAKDPNLAAFIEQVRNPSLPSLQ